MNDGIVRSGNLGNVATGDPKLWKVISFTNSNLTNTVLFSYRLAKNTAVDHWPRVCI